MFGDNSLTSWEVAAMPIYSLLTFQGVWQRKNGAGGRDREGKRRGENGQKCKRMRRGGRWTEREGANKCGKRAQDPSYHI